MSRRVIATDKKLDVKVLKRLIKYYLKYNKLSLFIVFVSIAIVSLISVAGSLFTRVLIDDYIIPLTKQANPDFTPLKKVLLIMASIYLVGIVFNYLYQKILIYVTHKTLKKTRDDLFAHMQTLPIKYFDTHPHGEIMSIYTNDIDTLRQVLSQTIPSLFSSTITIISVFISMLVLSVPLTFIIIFMLFIMRKAISWIGKNSSKYFKKQQSDIAKENGYIEEMMEGIKVVKVFNYEEEAINRFEKINDSLFNSSFNANKFSTLLMPIMGNLGNISYVLTAAIGGIFAIAFNSITVGTLASFLNLNKSFNMPVIQISNQFNAIIMAMAGAERVFKLLDEESETNEGDVTLVNVRKENGKLIECDECTNIWAWKHPGRNGEDRLILLKGDVRFYDVTFGYNENQTVLKNINLYAEPGQKLAFVGATGAGKTTITNLINRFYDIQEGSITYDGIDIKLINKNDLRRSLGIVLQETNLFSGTIKDNIKYANPEATDEEVIQAAKLANADGFIRHLEHGYDTVIKSDGSPLSQGQKQLLSIARAALANSPVLILDEATSSIDSRTEKIVQSGMDKLMSGRTTFVIAHRLSTIKNSNVILVLDHGEIIERGNHESLLKEKGTYYKLYTGLLEIE
ncbi:MAG: ABC transporter ATP-binding protein [Bacillota bacterium]|jgi:ATP-binding cassette subfamily B protein|nr:ABC transporter ATP-binding protein [Bacillota bacterium]